MYRITTKIALPLLLMSVVLGGCSEQLQEQPQEQNPQQSTMQLITRSGNTDFAVNDKIRIGVFNHNTYNNYQGKAYNDITATMGDAGWLFSFDGGELSSPMLSFTSDPDQTIDIIGVFPYISDTNLASVNFEIAKMKSIMWAKTSSPVSISGETFDATLDFQHLTAAMTFKIRAKNFVSEMRFYGLKIYLYESDGVTPKSELPKTVNINFHTGEIKINTKDNNFTYDLNGGWIYPELVKPETGDPYYYFKYTTYMPEFTLEPDDILDFAFAFETPQQQPVVLRIKASELDNGFKSGTNYIFDLILDNYLKFSGNIIKDTNWTVGDDINVSI